MVESHILTRWREWVEGPAESMCLSRSKSEYAHSHLPGEKIPSLTFPLIMQHDASRKILGKLISLACFEKRD